MSLLKLKRQFSPEAWFGKDNEVKNEAPSQTMWEVLTMLAAIGEAGHAEDDASRRTSEKMEHQVESRDGNGWNRTKKLGL